MFVKGEECLWHTITLRNSGTNIICASKQFRDFSWTSIQIQSALMLTSIQTRWANARYIPSFRIKLIMNWGSFLFDPIVSEHLSVLMLPQPSFFNTKVNYWTEQMARQIKKCSTTDSIIWMNFNFHPVFLFSLDSHAQDANAYVVWILSRK